MRSPHWAETFFFSSLGLALSLVVTSLHAQVPNDPRLPPLPTMSSAQLTDSVPSLTIPQLDHGIGATQMPGAGNPPTLPPLGNSGLSTPVSANPGMAVTGVVPGSTAFNQFSNPGGYFPPTEVQPASGTGLRNPQVAVAGQAGGSVMPPQATYRNTSMQYPNSSGGPAYTNAPATNAPGAYEQQLVLPPTQNGRPAPSTNQSAVVSTDPRFVSPAPAPRTGNYATSPYRGPFRTVAYQTTPTQAQLASQSMPVAQVATGLPSQPQAVQATSSLPQYQPTVGIHPTAYQTGYQYCAPTLPAGGVPAVVPGAMAPPTLPPNLTPQMYTPNNAGYRPLFSLGQENYNVQLGRGVIGQPTVYVPGQPVRNFLRYLSP